MKKLLTILFSVLALSTFGQVKTDLKLLIEKDHVWAHVIRIRDGDDYCGFFGLDTGEHWLLAVPTLLFNTDTANHAIHGYPNDGYITDHPLCAGQAYVIPNMQSFLITDYCTGDTLAFRHKTYFALQDNIRMIYPNGSWYDPDVRASILAENPDMDTLAVINAPYFNNATDTPFIYTSAGKGDKYSCDEAGNQLQAYNLRNKFVRITVFLTPPPTIYEGEENNGEGIHTNSDTYVAHFGDMLEYRYGADLPPLPECPTACDPNNPDPDSITVVGDDIAVEPNGSCDMADLQIQIVVTKKNMPDQQYNVTTFTLTDGGQVNFPFLNSRDLQRMVRSTIPSAYSGGKSFYRVRVGATILDLK